MAGKPGLHVPGGLYHVMLRGKGGEAHLLRRRVDLGVGQSTLGVALARGSSK